MGTIWINSGLSFTCFAESIWSLPQADRKLFTISRSDHGPHFDYNDVPGWLFLIKLVHIQTTILLLIASTFYGKLKIRSAGKKIHIIGCTCRGKETKFIVVLYGT